MPWFNLSSYNTAGVGGKTTAVNPSIGLKVTDSNSPNFGKVAGSASTLNLVRGITSYSSAERQLLETPKSNIKWLIVLLGLVIGYLLLKRK